MILKHQPLKTSLFKSLFPGKSKQKSLKYLNVLNAKL